MTKQEHLEKIVHARGWRHTPQRQLVFNYIEEASGPVTLAAMIDDLSDQIDRASIYRAVATYKQVGVIREVHQSGQHWLELGEAFSQHHHHITCVDCGLSRTIVSPKIEQHLQLIADRTGFKVIDHQLEINGRCSSCQALHGDQ